MAKIFDFDARQGNLRDKVSGKVFTNTETKLINTQKGRAASFNGSTSKLDTGLAHANLDLTGNITIEAWFNANSWGEGAAGVYGRILGNGTKHVGIHLSQISNELQFYNGLYTYSATGSIQCGIQYYHIVITQTSAGVTNFYLNGALSGTANQNSGTPTAGTTNLIIGNASDGSRTFNGQIPVVRIYNEILSAEKIQKLYNEFINSGNNVSVLRPKQKIQHAPVEQDRIGEYSITMDGGSNWLSSNSNISLGNIFTITLKGVFRSIAASFAPIFANKTNSTTEGCLIIQRQSTVNNTDIVFYPVGGSRTGVQVNAGIWDDVEHTLVLEYNNGSYIVKKDGVVTKTGTITNASGFSSSDIISVCSYNTGTTKMLGEIKSFSIENSSNYIYNVNEGRGNIIYDANNNINFTYNGTVKWINDKELILFHNYENGDALDLVDGYHGTPTNADFGKDGVNIRLNDTNSKISLGSTISTAKSCVFLINIKESGAVARTLCGTGTSINYIRIKSTLSSINIEGASSSVADIPYTFNLNNDYFIECVLNGTTWTVRINGVEVGSVDVGGTADVSINSIGGVSSYTLGGCMKFAKFYNYARTLAQHKADYNRYAKQLSFNEDMKNLNAENITYSAGSILPNGWKVESGSVKIIEKAKALTRELVTNGTFIDSDADGLADSWSAITNTTYSIVTGNGHVGNAQRYECPTGQINRFIYQPTVSLYKTYRISFYYRSKNAWYIGEQMASGMGVGLAANTGDAIRVNTTFYANGIGNPMRFYAASSEDWVEISNLSITEVQDIPEGTKIIEQVTAGITSIPCNIAYGTIEFDLFKGADSNSIIVALVSSGVNTTIYNNTGYAIAVDSQEYFLLKRMNGNGTASNIIASAISYIKNGHWYNIKITRTTVGVFTVYIKSPTDTNFINWTLVVAGGSGTNPVTDNTYTTNNYIVIDNDAGDKIANIKWYQGVEK